MRITIYISVFLFMAFCFSCEKQGLIVRCTDCTAEEPLDTNLEIKLDHTEYSSATIIKVYEGNLEDSVLYSSYKTSDSRTTIPVRLYKKFTVTATYYKLDNKYITVDSATPRVKFEKEQCNEPCYYVYDNVCDLRLKYTK